MKQLVLASTSPYRRALLDRLDVSYQVVDPRVDESRFRDLKPHDMALKLAALKASSVSPDNALVIGSDQVVELDGEALGKPGSVDAAVAQLKRLSGRAHRLLTAVAVHDTASGAVEVAVDVHTLWMRRLEETQLEAYVQTDRPLDCAGAYKLECRGIGLFERIEADPAFADDSAIIGLPIAKLLGLLRGFGWELLVQPSTREESAKSERSAE